MEINSFKFIIIILIIINGYLTIKINTIQKFFANKSKTNNLKIIHNLYKEFLQLYIENREKFYRISILLLYINDFYKIE